MPEAPSRFADELGLVARTLSETALYPFRRRLRLGVTGLARSGKTLFITALVNALTSGARLPGFGPVAEGRLLGASLVEQPHAGLPRFAFEEHRRALTGAEPHWPQSTRSISELSLLLRYRSKGLGTPTRELTLDIVGYPGEWLLDLSLLGLDYRGWSDKVLAVARKDTRAPGFLSADPTRPADPEADAAVAQSFRDWLIYGRTDPHRALGLTPGRFLLPGDMEGSPALTFAPLAPPRGTSDRRSVHALFERRFEAYKRLVVRPFFREHFARLDRQIVIADPLFALASGPVATAALADTLTEVLAAFRTGEANPLTRLVTRRIDRILFAASKADHIHSSSHERLEAILNALVANAARRVRFSGAATRSLALASVRATRESTLQTADGPHEVIVGTPEVGERLGELVYDGRTEIALFPGDLPDDPQAALIGTAPPVAFLRFRPPPLASGTGDLPFIRLDRALDWLIGDWMK